MITIIVTVLVLVYKRFCNTVRIYGHANKASYWWRGSETSSNYIDELLPNLYLSTVLLQHICSASTTLWITIRKLKKQSCPCTFRALHVKIALGMFPTLPTFKVLFSCLVNLWEMTSCKLRHREAGFNVSLKACVLKLFCRPAKLMCSVCGSPAVAVQTYSIVKRYQNSTGYYQR